MFHFSVQVFFSMTDHIFSANVYCHCSGPILLPIKKKSEPKVSFYYFNPLKSTQRGSNADRTDGSPPPENLVSYKTWPRENHTCWEKRGQQHHNSITITKKLPRMQITSHYSLAYMNLHLTRQWSRNNPVCESLAVQSRETDKPSWFRWTQLLPRVNLVSTMSGR